MDRMVQERLAQGLPEKIEDPAILRDIAVIFEQWEEEKLSAHLPA
jgi:hypothetical protein